MPSDKHNSIMAIDFSLFNIASSSDVYFCQLQQLQYLHHGSTKAHLFLTPFLYPLPHWGQFVVRVLWLW